MLNQSNMLNDKVFGHSSPPIMTNDADNHVKLHPDYEQASRNFDTDLSWIILQCATVHVTFQYAPI
jgi:hypothetical protein